MKLLSVDLGTRNLAWCILHRTPSSEAQWAVAPFHGFCVSIESWRLVDIVEEGSTETAEVNLNEIDIAKVVPWFTAVLRKYREELTCGVELALIEAQPTGRFVPGASKTISNVKTKVLSHILQSFLLDHGVSDVRFISPKVKLKDAKHLMDDPSDYRQHKKAARTLTDTCVAVIDANTPASSWQTWWTDRTGKRDDLADALLQGICAKLKTPQKPKTVKAPKKKKGKVEAPAIPAPDFELDV
jgi:hypothetical protein